MFINCKQTLRFLNPTYLNFIIYFKLLLTRIPFNFIRYGRLKTMVLRTATIEYTIIKVILAIIIKTITLSYYSRKRESLTFIKEIPKSTYRGGGMQIFTGCHEVSQLSAVDENRLFLCAF